MLEARAQMQIDVGNLFPQTQQMTGDHTNNVHQPRDRQPARLRVETLVRPVGYGFNLSWELDFWGRLRRAIESDAATLEGIRN